MYASSREPRFSHADQSTEKIFGDHSTEKRMAWTVACYRSGMNGYALGDHLSEQLFSAIGGYLANFSSCVGSISEKTYCQRAAYLSYT
jgi:hypothetical protein